MERLAVCPFGVACREDWRCYLAAARCTLSKDDESRWYTMKDFLPLDMLAGAL